MTSQEKLRMYIANHNTCTLATAMKDCPKCPFNPDNLKPAEGSVSNGNR